MDEFDNAVRLAVYRHFLSHKKAPQAGDIAQALKSNFHRIQRAFENLAAEHILVIEPDTKELLMAMPFSAVPTNYTLKVGVDKWWAN